MLNLLTKLFKSPGISRENIALINDIEKEITGLSNDDLLKASEALKQEIRAITDKKEQREMLDAKLPRAFALVREAARRTLKQRHFDVQLMGGASLHQGRIVEMRTGEGKTLSATAPVYLNALAGRGVHVVTVNEYLARRDTVWMGQVYAALGLTVACLVHEGALMYDPQYAGTPSKNANVPDAPLREGSLIDKERDTTGSFLVQTEYLRPVSRKDAYEADITYGTNHEFGFDYLRDNLAYNLDRQVQRRGRYFAIIDEVDSILIDEARTPLIISAPDAESSEFYKTFARLVSRLTKDEDYMVDEKMRSVEISQVGIDKVEQSLKVTNLYGGENVRLTHYLQESLKAKELFLKDRDYVVKNGEIIIVDQFTGRLMLGRRYSGGLHQAIEAKESVHVNQESRTYASISIQNYFRLYDRISGMTGTAQTSAEEFDKVYGLPVVTVPTHRDMIRIDLPDLIYKNREAKFDAIVKDIKARHEKGQPILIGTVSIEKNEELARYLTKAGLPHELLNAKNNEREGAIIAQAGKFGAITIATNLAGRGVDIILGGNPATKEDAQRVRAAGGLHVIGTERHDSRRIDNQLRGRAGRQGDPGSSQFFLSLDDDLMRIFGGERIKGFMDRLKVPADMPIQAGMINRSVSQAQSKVEGMHFDSRKHLLDFDDVLNKQRLAIYRKRQDILETNALVFPKKQFSDEGIEVVTEKGGETEKKTLSLSPSALSISLSTLDMFWMTHLENMEALSEAVRLRAYGQHDPLVEYRREGYDLFQALMREFDAWILENGEKIVLMKDTKPQSDNVINFSALPPKGEDGKVGRNDPCPCGSGKKYKKCHGA